MRVFTTILMFASVILQGCRVTDQPGVDVETGMARVCQECYDAVNAARKTHPSRGEGQNETIRSYDCPCCKASMSIYVQDGMHMVRCVGCAPDGVAWNQCVPSAM